MDTKDGLIWLNLGDSVKPVKATYLNTHKNLYVYHNKVYNRNWYLQDEANPSILSYEDRSIDLSNVKNPSELHQISSDSEFFDNQQYYSLGKDSRTLEKPPLLPISNDLLQRIILKLKRRGFLLTDNKSIPRNFKISRFF